MSVGRLARVLGWTAAGAVYVWFAAVGNAESVKVRKAARRADRRARAHVRS